MKQTLQFVKLCDCGCGQPTYLAPQTHRKYGWQRNQPMRFLRGHGRVLVRVYPQDGSWTYEDRGHATPCWIWTGAYFTNGYACYHEGRKKKRAHRVIFERALHRKIRKGLTLDHLCRVIACVNPEHMEEVTNAENIRRENLARYAA